MFIQNCVIHSVYTIGTQNSSFKMATVIHRVYRLSSGYLCSMLERSDPITTPATYLQLKIMSTRFVQDRGYHRMPQAYRHLLEKFKSLQNNQNSVTHTKKVLHFSTRYDFMM